MRALQLLEVLQTINLISSGMNTCSVVEASLKTRDFNCFGMRTYRKCAYNHV
jgi:hypothetical protein